MQALFCWLIDFIVLYQRCRTLERSFHLQIQLERLVHFSYLVVDAYALVVVSTGACMEVYLIIEA